MEIVVFSLDKGLGCVFVSGGVGFVDSWTVEKLVDKYSCVVVLDNLYSGGHGNLRSCLDRVVFVEGISVIGAWFLML